MGHYYSPLTRKLFKAKGDLPEEDSMFAWKVIHYLIDEIKRMNPKHSVLVEHPNDRQQRIMDALLSERGRP